MPSEGYNLSVLREEDLNLNSIAEIKVLLAQLSESGASTIDRKILVRALRDDMVIIVARQGKRRIVGMGIVCRVPRLTRVQCEIHDIVVDRDHRRKGLGDEILKRLISTAYDRFNPTYIDLTSRPEREEANKLYVKQGFELRNTNSYRYTCKK